MAAPEAMTYDSLVTDMQSYAERSDTAFVEQIPRFIMMAENKLASEARGLGYLRYVTSALEVGNPVVAKPARWRETSSFKYQSDTGPVYLKYRSYEYCRVYGSSTTGNAAPEYYGDYGYEHFILARTPDQAYVSELAYYERPEPLSLENQTNWTTQYAPQLILFGSLCAAQTWLKLADRAAEFKGLYMEALSGLMNEASRRITDNSQIRSPA